jgi:type I restriction enzyme S subunit
MSSKTQTTATKEEATPALVPKLRFPEFRDAGGWTTETLGSVARISTEKVGENTCIPMSITSGVGLVSQMEKFGRIIAGSSYSNYLLLKKNDFAYNKSATKEYPEGFIALYSGDELAAVPNSIFTCFRIKGDSPVPQYLNYLLLGNLHGRWLRHFIEVGARAHGSLSIDEDDLLALPVPLPSGQTSLPEQQKIAECLSSVDELIAAQARKLDALKTHKKGLMQQLFPREGETQPRLRFPEFQNAGDWEVRTIGEMFSLINGCAFKPEDWQPSGTPIIRIQNLNDPSAEFNYSQAPVPERNRIESGDLLFAWSGTLGSSFGARIWNGPSGVLNQHIFKVLMDEQQITLQFALLVLARVEEEIARRTHGFKASFVHVKKSDLVQVEMLLPSVPEQQHIATCLSSLDALITAETQKHEALKTHKKGLMQQLFPSPEEVEA